MVADPTKPTRPEISKIANGNPRVIEAFERLFDVAGVELPEQADASQVALSAIDGRARAGGVKAEAALAFARMPQRRKSYDFDHIDFHLGHGDILPRRMQWNDEAGTLDIGLNDDVTLQIGQEIVYSCKNTSGVTIANGSPVVATGTVGASGKLTVAPAISDGTYDQKFYIGVATQDILHNDFGFVTQFGLVRGIDTSAYVDGDLLYVSDTVAGAWVSSEPAAPNWRQAQAIVVHAGSGGSGSIFSRARAEHKLTGLIDVQASPSDGDTLQYNAANARWEAVNGASGSFTTSAGVTVTVVNGLITSIV